MSSDEGDGVLLWCISRRKNKLWVHPYFIKKNVQRRSFVGAQELDVNLVKFQEFYRMSKEIFNELVRLVGPNYRKAINCLFCNILIGVFIQSVVVNARIFFYFLYKFNVAGLLVTRHCSSSHIPSARRHRTPSSERVHNATDCHMTSIANCAVKTHHHTCIRSTSGDSDAVFFRRTSLVTPIGSLSM